MGSRVAEPKGRLKHYNVFTSLIAKHGSLSYANEMSNMNSS